MHKALARQSGGGRVVGGRDESLVIVLWNKSSLVALAAAVQVDTSYM